MNTIHLSCPHCNASYAVRVLQIEQLQRENILLKQMMKSHGITIPSSGTYGQHLDIFLTSCVLPDSVVDEEISGPILLPDHTTDEGA